jgi:hypothetical protein
MSECEWHLADRKARCELDSAKFTKGLRKSMPPKSYYDLDAEKYALAVERGKKLGS